MNTTFFQYSAVIAVCLIIVATAGYGQNCADSSVGMIPLNDLGSGMYRGYAGGLYPGGSNARPPADDSIVMAFARGIQPLDTNGAADAVHGKIVLLSIGMSNATDEFSVFRGIADTAREKNPQLTIVDGAQGGQTAAIIEKDPAHFWTVVAQRLAAAGVTPIQVQAAWIKEADANPAQGFPGYADTLEKELGNIAHIVESRFPNIKIAYLSSRIYGGYATTSLNPEPYAYQSGFAVKWLIESQIRGDTALAAGRRAPLLLWGPYLWADGLKPRSDGLTWQCADFQSDGTHPSMQGRLKVAQMLLKFFESDSTAAPWFDISSSAPTPLLLKGVSLSPKGLQPADFTDFFQKASEAGNAVMWAGDWMQLADTAQGAPAMAAGLASVYHYTPVIEAQFFTQATGALLRPLNDSTKLLYARIAAAFAKKYSLPFLGLGIEVNVLAEKSPADFSAFVALFRDVYDSVKAASPATKVFTVFQLEKMKGLDGGLYGGVNDTTKTEWALLDSFPQSDIAAFTTYPGLIFKDPSDIRADFYAEIAAHTNKPVAFTEIGWHSAAEPAGWESSDAEQAGFITTFFADTKPLDETMAIWSFLYDQDTLFAPVPFNSMGLWRRDGTAKPAWNAWLGKPAAAREENAVLAGGALLSQNYPNPFSANTMIFFSLPRRQTASVTVYDLFGRTIRTLYAGEAGAGGHSVAFNANALPDGVYFYLLSTPCATLRKTMLVIR